MKFYRLEVSSLQSKRQTLPSCGSFLEKLFEKLRPSWHWQIDFSLNFDFIVS